MKRGQYIIMPVQGWRSDRMLDFHDGRVVADIAHRAADDVVRVASIRRAPLVAPDRDGMAAPYTVVASSHENGPKLVEMSAQAAAAMRSAVPSAVIERNLTVQAAVRPAARMARSPTKASGDLASRVRVKVVDEEGRPVPGARVLAYTDRHRGIGASRRTQVNGRVSFGFGASGLPRLSVEAPAGYAGFDEVDVAGDTVEVVLRKVDPSTMVDAVAQWTRDLPPGRGKGVRIAVVDTGVNTAHPDLAHVADTVVYSWGDPDPAVDPHPHATHVAGIIGARGPHYRGVAAEADLKSFRVTPLGEKKSDFFHLGEGIEKAARSDVHLINVSMVAGAPSEYLSKAASVAFRNGAVCIAASGNDGRNTVSHPAAGKRYIAVSAYGDRSVLAANALELSELSDVLSKSQAMLARARFANWGSDTDFIAPGVGLISCLGGGGYAMDSGTSFAAPVITGLAAIVLSEHYPQVLAMPPGPARAAAITQALLTRGKDLGFAFETQGIGILDVV